MPEGQTPARRNLDFYEPVWATSRLVAPHQFNTWPRLSPLLGVDGTRLEIGPGLHPRLPLSGTRFVDLSHTAARRLRAAGGLATVADATALPFPDQGAGLVCAFDIVEHVADDARIFAEIARVAADDAPVLLSVPLHRRLWTAFDALVGHVRRYEPRDLVALLDAHGLRPEESAVFGMQPRNRLLLAFATWGLRDHREVAIRWYDRWILPLGLRRQRPLRWATGLIDLEPVDEVVLMCRRIPRRRSQLRA